MSLTKAEKQRLKKQKRAEEKAQVQSSAKNKKVKITATISAVVIVLVAFAIFTSVANSNKPGLYDDFARCLNEKGLVMYGADWCTYTAGQKDMFGKSFAYLNYKDYTETTGVTSTPTWELGDERYPKVQSFETLSEISGCTLPQR